MHFDRPAHTSDNRPQTGKKAVVVSKYADATQEEARPASNDALMEGRAVELDRSGIIRRGMPVVCVS